MQKIIAVITLAIALLVVNWSICKKEMLLIDGDTVFLKLAPVDPRSLMQGDYMALRFEIAEQISVALTQDVLLSANTENKKFADGLVVVALDDNSVASFIKIIDDHTVKQDNINQDITNQKIVNQGKNNKQSALQFRLRKGQVKFASNAYFFEEGAGNELAQARYGEFRVGENGELILVSLCDENLKKIA